MNLKQESIKIGNKIKEYKYWIIGVLIVIVLLAHYKIIPTTFTITTFSLFGGGIATISIGAILLTIGIIFIFISQEVPVAVITGLFLIGGWIIAGGTALTVLVSLFSSFVGYIIVVAILLGLYLWSRK